MEWCLCVGFAAELQVGLITFDDLRSPPATDGATGLFGPAEPIGPNPHSQLDDFVVSPSTMTRKIGEPPSQIEPSWPAAPCMLGRW